MQIKEALWQIGRERRAKGIFLLAQQISLAFSCFDIETGFEETAPLARKTAGCLEQLREVIAFDSPLAFASEIQKLGIKTPREENLCLNQIFVLLDYSRGEHELTASLAKVNHLAPNLRVYASAVKLAQISRLQPQMQVASNEEAQNILKVKIDPEERVILPITYPKREKAAQPQRLNFPRLLRTAA